MKKAPRYLAIAYMLVCVFLASKHLEFTPFYNWAMYHLPVPVSNQATFYEIYADSNLYYDGNSWADNNRLYTTYTLDKYDKLIHHQQYDYDKNKSEINPSEYELWLKAYISTKLRKKVTTLIVW